MTNPARREGISARGARGRLRPEGAKGYGPAVSKSSYGREQEAYGQRQRTRSGSKTAPVRAVDPDADQKLLEEIGYLLTADDDLDAGDVEAQVEAGVVTLTGSVSSKELKRRCGELAETASGQPVVNQLKVSRS